MIGKMLRTIRRRREARRWGIAFSRVRDFAMPDRLLLGGGTMRLSFPPGGEVVTAFVALLLDDEYGLDAIPKLGSGARPVRTILDIGGNVGLFTLAARRRFPDALLHVYEPNRTLEPHLRVQAAGAGAVCFIEAVGAEDGEVSFFPTLDSMTGTVVPASAIAVDRAEAVTVPQTALRRALDRLGGEGGTVDLVKMDCEGAEWAMLEDRASLARIGRLLLEYHPRPGRDAEALPGLLAAGGLEIEKRIATAGGCGVIWASRSTPLGLGLGLDAAPSEGRSSAVGER